MRIYKRSFAITVSLSVFSLLMAIILNYGFKEQFWCNVCLGVFGSSVLTAITSIIGYFTERRSVTEGFYSETLKILKQLNKYQELGTLNEKIDFYLFLSDYDTSVLDMYFGKMDFFNNIQREYIYEKIYNPLSVVKRKVNSRAYHFRTHKSGTDKNDVVMQNFVNEIETHILKSFEREIQTEDGKIIVASTKNKIVEELLAELDGKYYGIMYGKKKMMENKTK